jgi:hypothetical protein
MPSTASKIENDAEDRSDALAEMYRKQALELWFDVATETQRSDLAVLLVSLEDQATIFQSYALEVLSKERIALGDHDLIVAIVAQSEAELLLKALGEDGLAQGLARHSFPTICMVVFAYDLINCFGFIRTGSLPRANPKQT